MYTGDPSPTIRRVWLNMDVPHPVEWGGTHFHTQLEAVKTFELCRHRSAQHQLGLLEDEVSKLFASYGNHMETIWKPYGNHMKPCSFHCPTGPNISTPSAVFQPFHKARADRGGAHVAVAYSGSSGMVAGLRLEDSVRCRR